MQFAAKAHRSTQGGVLALALFMACLIGFFLFSYLSLARHQRHMVARAQAWNGALGMAEAGVEEALAQLDPGAPKQSMDLTANGWGNAAGGLYGPVSRTFSNGSYAVVYTTDTYPIIYSTGYVAIPSIPATLTRVLQVITTNLPLYSAGMACRSNINFNGNGIYTDSFDSSNPNLSTNGRYDSTKTSTNGNVGSIYGLVNVGNANIYGKLLLGPTAGNSVGANGLVTGGVYNDFNYEFADVQLPKTTWQTATALSSPLSIDGVSYPYVFGDGQLAGGDYVINGLSGNLYVGSNTVVRLRLTGSASPQTLRVAGASGSDGKLTIYMDGASFTMNGSSVVDGGLAGSLTYYGTTNNTQITFSANAAFTGTIYAPEAYFTLGGGGNSTYDFVGACFVNCIKMNGHYAFHYDEALLSAGPVRGFLPFSWKEL